jgi:hypothetical protein
VLEFEKYSSELEEMTQNHAMELEAGARGNQPRVSSEKRLQVYAFWNRHYPELNGQHAGL